MGNTPVTEERKSEVPVTESEKWKRWNAFLGATAVITGVVAAGSIATFILQQFATGALKDSLHNENWGLISIIFFFVCACLLCMLHADDYSKTIKYTYTAIGLGSVGCGGVLLVVAPTQVQFPLGAEFPTIFGWAAVAIGGV